MNENIVTLWQDALHPESIPPYPSFEMCVGTGKELTYDLRFQDNGPPHVIERLAKRGEILKDIDLKYVVDYTKNLEFRAEIMANAHNNPKYQQLQYQFCKSNILYFANTFCWTYDPRLLPHDPTIPFITFPVQDDLITWTLGLLKNHQSGLIEKSRDMGATWCMQIVMAYHSLFFNRFTGYQLSLKEGDVDNRKPNSLLGKYRFLLEHLPPWFRCGWTPQENGIDNKMAITLPATKSDILGQLTGGTAGRSGRATLALYDEFAFIENSESVLDANSSLASTDIYLSTPNGMGNAFYRMASDKNIRKKSLHWSKHFQKNELWASKEKSNPKYTEERWAQEQEICYEKSTTGRVFPEFQSFSASPYVWTHSQTDPYFQFDPNFDVYLGLDFGMSDPTSAVFCQIKPTPLDFIQFSKYTYVIFSEYEENSKTVDFWANFIKNQPYQYKHIIGDFRSGNQRDATGNTWKTYLQKHGVQLVGKRSSEESTIMKLRELLNTPGSIAFYQTPHLIQAMQNWAYPKDKRTGILMSGASPRHDQWSHSIKALLYLIDYIHNPEKEKYKQQKPIDWNFKSFNQSFNL